MTESSFATVDASTGAGTSYVGNELERVAFVLGSQSRDRLYSVFCR